METLEVAREIVQNFAQKFCESREDKMTKQRELRKKVEARREERSEMGKVQLNRLLTFWGG